ncbi:MAG TPA: hypothetical protein VMU51_25350, partial [Mycobacteriales bacterium]|nr:hypothetical protein [Mycobacteriales bacterium]
MDPVLQGIAEILAGQSYPRGDFEKMFALAAAWDGLARDLAGIEDLVLTAARAVGLAGSGEAIDAATQYLYKIAASDPGFLPALRKAATDIAGMVRKAALQIQYAKYLIDVTASFMAAQIAYLYYLAVVTAGQSLDLVPAVIKAGQVAVQEILLQAVEAVLHGILFQIIPDLIVQGIQALKGDRAEFDAKTFLNAVEMGAIQGALGFGLTQLGSKFMPAALNTLPGAMAKGGAEGAIGAAVINAIGGEDNKDGIAGGFESGAIGGAINHGIGRFGGHPGGVAVDPVRDAVPVPPGLAAGPEFHSGPEVGPVEVDGGVPVDPAGAPAPVVPGGLVPRPGPEVLVDPAAGGEPVVGPGPAVGERGAGGPVPTPEPAVLDGAGAGPVTGPEPAAAGLAAGAGPVTPRDAVVGGRGAGGAAAPAELAAGGRGGPEAALAQETGAGVAGPPVAVAPARGGFGPDLAAGRTADFAGGRAADGSTPPVQTVTPADPGRPAQSLGSDTGPRTEAAKAFLARQRELGPDSPAPVPPPVEPARTAGPPVISEVGRRLADGQPVLDPNGPLTVQPGGAPGQPGSRPMTVTDIRPSTVDGPVTANTISEVGRRLSDGQPVVDSNGPLTVQPGGAPGEPGNRPMTVNDIGRGQSPAVEPPAVPAISEVGQRLRDGLPVLDPRGPLTVPPGGAPGQPGSRPMTVNDIGSGGSAVLRPPAGSTVSDIGRLLQDGYRVLDPSGPLTVQPGGAPGQPGSRPMTVNDIGSGGPAAAEPAAHTISDVGRRLRDGQPVPDPGGPLTVQPGGVPGQPGSRPATVTDIRSSIVDEPAAANTISEVGQWLGGGEFVVSPDGPLTVRPGGAPGEPGNRPMTVSDLPASEPAGSPGPATGGYLVNGDGGGGGGGTGGGGGGGGMRAHGSGSGTTLLPPPGTDGGGRPGGHEQATRAGGDPTA